MPPFSITTCSCFGFSGQLRKSKIQKGEIVANKEMFLVREIKGVPIRKEWMSVAGNKWPIRLFGSFLQIDDLEGRIIRKTPGDRNRYDNPEITEQATGTDQR